VIIGGGGGCWITKEVDMEWLQTNWGQLVVIVSLLVNLFCAVAALTTTKKDDAVAAWLKNALGRFLSVK